MAAGSGQRGLMLRAIAHVAARRPASWIRKPREPYPAKPYLHTWRGSRARWAGVQRPQPRAGVPDRRGEPQRPLDAAQFRSGDLPQLRADAGGGNGSDVIRSCGGHILGAAIAGLDLDLTSGAVLSRRDGPDHGELARTVPDDVPRDHDSQRNGGQSVANGMPEDYLAGLTPPAAPRGSHSRRLARFARQRDRFSRGRR